MADTPSLWTIDDVVTHVYGVGVQLGHDLQLGDEGSDAEVEFDAHCSNCERKATSLPRPRLTTLTLSPLWSAFANSIYRLCLCLCTGAYSKVPGYGR
jgi:hypothetical protein